MRVLILLSLFVATVFARDDFMIARSIIKHSIKSGIDPKIVYTIAKIESGFKPLAIAFTTSQNQGFEFDEAVVRRQAYKDKYLISISPSSKRAAKAIAKELIGRGYRVDVGLMQINSINFKASELDMILDIDGNIKKSLEVLSICQQHYGNTKNIIECYNKGFNADRADDYYNRFKKSFNRDFGGAV